MPEEDNNKSLDILGIKPVGESVKIVTQGTVDGAGAFLSRICLPAAEEFGLLMKDHISGWRAANAVKIAEKAEQKLASKNSDAKQANPKLIMKAIEAGSWHDDDLFQEAWAGLLASSCSEDGKDDSNIIFINILEKLTSLQVKILNYICENGSKVISPKSGWPYCKEFIIPFETLINIVGDKNVDPHRLDRELDFLRGNELISFNSGFDSDSKHEADITPTPLALHLYIRCQGFIGTPVEYWDLKEDSD